MKKLLLGLMFISLVALGASSQEKQKAGKAKTHQKKHVKSHKPKKHTVKYSHKKHKQAKKK